jgi:hypothetical protein
MQSDTTINIYSDEANHLKDPSQGNSMVIGSVWCKKESVKTLSDTIRKVKEYHGYKKTAEVKWTKISPKNVGLYEDLIKVFFNSDVSFRAIVIPKDRLDHQMFHQTDDDFYYKMQYLMMTNIARNNDPAKFNLFIDYKDIWSNARSVKLSEYLGNKADFSHCEFTAQPVRSHESELLQLADILIGATAYRNNHFDKNQNAPKHKVVRLVEEGALQRLNQISPPTALKVNIFMWSPR